MSGKDTYIEHAQERGEKDERRKGESMKRSDEILLHRLKAGLAELKFELEVSNGCAQVQHKRLVERTAELAELREHVTYLEADQENLRIDNTGLREALEEILDCPQGVDQATVPKGGVEVAPEQVVLNFSVGLLRVRKAREALAGGGSDPLACNTCGERVQPDGTQCGCPEPSEDSASERETACEKALGMAREDLKVFNRVVRSEKEPGCAPHCCYPLAENWLVCRHCGKEIEHEKESCTKRGQSMTDDRPQVNLKELIAKKEKMQAE